MKSIRVVLADDHAVMRSSIRKFLEDAPDIEVIGEARNGVEALDLSKKLTPDVLLIDMEMPYMTGVEVAQQLQAVNSPIRTLALSAHDDWQYIRILLEDVGAAGYLIKSEVQEIIVEAVRGVAQGERGWISRQVASLISSQTSNQPRQRVQLPLTGREKSVLRLIGANKSNREIGLTLKLSKRLVETYLETLFAKLGVTSKKAAKRALRDRLM